MKPLINLNISSKEELDTIIRQYDNGGRALSAMWDYENDILRHAYKHGNDQYLEDIKRLLAEENKNIDEDILYDVANACLDYFRAKFYEIKQENSVDEWT